ncbi:MAG: hypothetical protein ACOCWO_02690 [Candidatus Muiribacteriaceae bacterium]
MIRMIEIEGNSGRGYKDAADNALGSLRRKGEKVHFYSEKGRHLTEKGHNRCYKVMLNVAIQI